MIESRDEPSPDQDPSQEVEHSGSQGTTKEAHGGTGDEDSGPEQDAQAGSGVTPLSGGYEGRDPKSEMPRIPSVPESQDDDK